MSQVGSAIDACSSSNTEASLKAAIAQGVANKALADQVPLNLISSSPVRYIQLKHTISGCGKGSELSKQLKINEK